MTDYFQNFSFVVPCSHGVAAKLVRAINDEIENIVDWFDSDEAEGDDPPPSAIFDTQTLDWAPSVYVVADPDGLWFSSPDGSEDIDRTVEAVRWVLDQPGIEVEWVIFQWGNSASRPILDAYGGGVVLVSKDETRWMNTGKIASDWEQEMKEKRHEAD